MKNIMRSRAGFRSNKTLLLLAVFSVITIASHAQQVSVADQKEAFKAIKVQHAACVNDLKHLVEKLNEGARARRAAFAARASARREAFVTRARARRSMILERLKPSTAGYSHKIAAQQAELNIPELSNVTVNDAFVVTNHSTASSTFTSSTSTSNTSSDIAPAEGDNKVTTRTEHYIDKYRIDVLLVTSVTLYTDEQGEHRDILFSGSKNNKKQPLLIIDDKIREDIVLSDIDAKTIKHIDLYDYAHAPAQYRSKAKNGVIKFTTK